MRPIAFGHVGDGNIHFNLAQPVGAESAAFLAALEPESTDIVHDIARNSAARSAPSTASAS